MVVTVRPHMALLSLWDLGPVWQSRFTGISHLVRVALAARNGFRVLARCGSEIL